MHAYEGDMYYCWSGTFVYASYYRDKLHYIGILLSHCQSEKLEVKPQDMDGYMEVTHSAQTNHIIYTLKLQGQQSWNYTHTHVQQK